MAADENEQFALYLRDPSAWRHQYGAPGLIAAIERDRARGNHAGAKRRWNQAGAALRAITEQYQRTKEAA